ncbi:hypothetical protein THAOC_01705 [Thalassiosira oceanica]|uniref:RING-type domain-containing protein n=1 Tax=Thalassiosira oceanica TaxID=159749 RepID=K0TCR7_THAOC|nr:hypothetical protein THAOC_01705 [Thalassiosira oceanica]|eukprot:EJK76528.1 hypothetical protein THAOC_01705 [Thalassiosira oceanica]
MIIYLSKLLSTSHARTHARTSLSRSLVANREATPKGGDGIGIGRAAAASPSGGAARKQSCRCAGARTGRSGEADAKEQSIQQAGKPGKPGNLTPHRRPGGPTLEARTTRQHACTIKYEYPPISSTFVSRYRIRYPILVIYPCREMILLPTSIASLFGRRKARSMERRTRRSSGSIAGGRGANAQRENGDVINIGGSDPHLQVRQSTRDRNGRPTTNCPDRYKAMEDLQDVTFVVTNENLELAVDNERDDTSSAAADDEGCMPAKPQRHLVLPDAGICKPCGSISNRRRANECAICFTEYDVGDVIVYSKHCRHVFHQECMLEWLSRGNDNCPTCRSTFYVPTDIKAEDSFDEVEISLQERQLLAFKRSLQERQRLAFRRVDLISD